MSFSRPTLKQLKDRSLADLEGRFPGADGRLRQSALGALAAVHAGGMHGLYGYLDFVARQILPDQADAEFLQRWAGVYGVARKAASAAGGTVTAVGTNGVVIPQGTALQRGDGLEYMVTTSIMVAGGGATLEVVAAAPGLAGRAEAGVKLSFVSPIALSLIHI